MADDLNAVRAIRRAMSMVKTKMLSLPEIDHFQFAAQPPIMIPGNNDDLA